MRPGLLFIWAAPAVPVLKMNCGTGLSIWRGIIGGCGREHIMTEIHEHYDAVNHVAGTAALLPIRPFQACHQAFPHLTARERKALHAIVTVVHVLCPR